MASKKITPNGLLKNIASFKGRQFGIKQSAFRRIFQKAKKEAMQQAMRFWHQKYLPLHFEPIAFRRYAGFRTLYDQWRTVAVGKFMRFLFAKFGKRAGQLVKDQKKQNPLESTGHLRRQVEGEIRISGSGNRVKGVMLYGRPKLSPELRQALDEAGYFKGRSEYTVGYGKRSTAVFQELLTATNDQEEASLAKIVEDLVISEIQAKSKTLSAELRF